MRWHMCLETTRNTLRDLFGEVKVDRTGTGYADVQLDSLLPTKVVAGARFGNCLLTLPRARRKPV